MIVLYGVLAWIGLSVFAALLFLTVYWREGRRR